MSKGSMLKLLLCWTECSGQEPPVAKREMTVEHLTTRQVADRMQVSVTEVGRLLASGKLSGTKVGAKWQIAAASLREYVKTAPVKLRADDRKTAGGRKRVHNS